MHHLIHGGADRIGGMCVEVRADDGTRILLDLGMPLYDAEGNDFAAGTAERPTSELIAEGILPDIKNLYAEKTDEPDVVAILLSHAHIDHWGLAHHAHPAIPVYGSRGTLALLGVMRVFFPWMLQPSDLREMPTDEPFSLGPFTITAIPVDHAAPDSRAFLVEADGQRLVYSGDLRAHGRTKYHFEALLRDERLRGADWLLLEGTTLGGDESSHGCNSEDDVELGLAALCREARDQLVTVLASGQNLDRLVSCYRAAKRTGRQLVVSAYQAYVLRELSMLSKNVPQFEWDLVRVKFFSNHYKALQKAGMIDLVLEMQPHKVTTEQLAADPGDYLWVTGSNTPATLVLNLIGASKVVPVWSMWSGYWEREPVDPIHAWCDRAGVEPRFIHSGGHAGPGDLRRLADAIAAHETVWVHTDGAKPSEVRV